MTSSLQSDSHTLSSQEGELIRLIRTQNPQEFTLTVAYKGGRWFVGLHVPELTHQRADGDGETFAEAWENVRPSWM